MLFDSSVWAQRLLLPALALSSLPIGACNDKPASDLGFGVSFACEADREQSDQLRLRILSGGCKPDAEARYEATLAKGESAPPANGVGPGTYGIEATSLSGGELVAYACVVAKLPTTQSLDIKLESDNCEAALDAGEFDAKADVDAEIDAASIPCDTDCSDGLPCTDDVCVDGVCTNPPITGPLECDGIACTQADQCEAGNCVGAGPINAACPDDGNLCTAEACVVGAGCNRTNAPSTTPCADDGISCTSTHFCSNGVCRGTVDTCVSMGQVCLASGTCIDSPCPTNCDDGNPCTDDVCIGSVCSNPANSLGCSDGKSCTSSDTCSNKICVGTNTCPRGSTCGGSICSCTTAGQTPCSNGCFNLSNTPLHCGSCTRACDDGQTCQNSGCKPADATTCTAHRSGSHDYLVCDGSLTWTEARDKCRTWNMGLVVIDNQAENQFLQERVGSVNRWIGANDRGDNGNDCTKSAEEGSWYWARPLAIAGDTETSNDNGTLFCTAANGTSCAAQGGRYQNWSPNEPNNSGCSCIIFICGNAPEGQDCGTMTPDGTWDDFSCSPAMGSRLGFICESP